MNLVVDDVLSDKDNKDFREVCDQIKSIEHNLSNLLMQLIFFVLFRERTRRLIPLYRSTQGDDVLARFLERSITIAKILTSIANRSSAKVSDMPTRGQLAIIQDFN